MRLTDLKIKSAEHGEKAKKLFDERGLFLLLQPSGSKLWRLRAFLEGKELKLSLGRYPEVSLKKARAKAEKARSLIADGIHPAEEKRLKRKASEELADNTFEIVGQEYLEKMKRDGRAAVTMKKSSWLLSLLLLPLGTRPISDIKPAELLSALQLIEQKGQLETARRMRSLASRIFRYAVATSRAESDPTSLLRGALASPKVKHHAAILDPVEFGALLRAIDGFTGQPLTKLALQLTPHVFVRPGELRRAEWDEFDFEAAKWTIPAEKMKMRDPHIVPLSKQSLTILEQVRALSSQQKYVFSSMYPGNRPMSENTINAALRRMGFGKEEMTAHGFRASASTMLNESRKWSPDAIERALGHSDHASVRGTYHRGLHWDERTRMAQWWSDHLDQLRHHVR